MSPTKRHLPAPHRLALVVGVVALGALTAACAPREPVRTGSIDLDGYRTRHPIVVEEGDETLDIPVGTQAQRLPANLALTVESFGREARRQGASGVTLLVPSGSVNEAAAYRLSKEITAALVRGGVAPHAIGKKPYAAAGPEDAAPIRIAYPRVVARVPHECGEWPSSATSDLGNRDYWNFGCATQSNIAAMVENPTDLVAPAPIGAPDATRRAIVLQAYRKGEKTKSLFALPSPSVSDVSGGSE